jgi:hypothetical protein
LIAAARPTTDPLLHDLHRPHTSADFHRSAILPHRTTKTPAESSFTRKRNAPARTLTANRHLVEQLCEDDHLLAEFVTGLITPAQGNGQRVRAFGEMVALLWAQGDIAATIRLERLWHEMCKSQNFSLLCAYPKTGCTLDASESIAEIYATHTRII